MQRERRSRESVGAGLLLLPGCGEEPRSLLQTLTAVALFASRRSHFDLDPETGLKVESFLAFPCRICREEVIQ
jgi:hypothetical protein